MLYRLAADSVVLIHLFFIVFVVLGGLLALLWRWIVLLHLPAVAWGITVEWLHLYCPLTPLENVLRNKAGASGYEGGFIEHYLIALIYPTGLTANLQLVLGAIVVLVNLLVYGVLLLRWQRRRRSA
jgi:hypothetical protein